MKKVVIATRGSKLALWQADAVCDAIRNVSSEYEPELLVITTKGDKDLDTKLSALGDKGIFVEELEEALLEGRADICVHSVKDMPGMLKEGCFMAATLKRADVHDVLLVQGDADPLSILNSESLIGTGSLRRAAQLKAAYPEVNPASIRGNVDTRIRKLDEATYDAVVLAKAGLCRLGFDDRIAFEFPFEEMIPAAGQGAIGLEIRQDDNETKALCEAICDKETYRCVSAERMVMAALGGSCKAPFGVYARIEKEMSVLDAFTALPDASEMVKISLCLDKDASAQELADEAMRLLEEEGAIEILRRAEAMEQAGEVDGK
ncbi:MAG: hydroxymethylbilane synthase [Eggerthellaceae bacterium]|nr:hydroxymethylbilane synthase [Eggerthellaceae bacterium]